MFWGWFKSALKLVFNRLLEWNFHSMRCNCRFKIWGFAVEFFLLEVVDYALHLLLLGAFWKLGLHKFRIINIKICQQWIQLPLKLGVEFVNVKLARDIACKMRLSSRFCYTLISFICNIGPIIRCWIMVVKKWHFIVWIIQIHFYLLHTLFFRTVSHFFGSSIPTRGPFPFIRGIDIIFLWSYFLFNHFLHFVENFQFLCWRLRIKNLFPSL